jgi:hypothetical protein
MRTELKDPQYWRFRAEEAMSIAENLLEKEELKDVCGGFRTITSAPRNMWRDGERASRSRIKRVI